MVSWFRRRWSCFQMTIQKFNFCEKLNFSNCPKSHVKVTVIITIIS